MAKAVVLAAMPDQYADSTKLQARQRLHAKYGPPGGVTDLASIVPLPVAARVLEVGCGFGRFWVGAAAVYPPDLEITLTDLSPGMLVEALATVRSLRRWAKVDGEVADVCALPFPDASFDVVLAMHVLYHASDPDLAVAEIARVLRPAGMAVVTTNGERTLEALFALGHRVLGGPSADPGAAAFGLDRGAAALRRWFQDVEVVRHTDVLRVTDPADVVAYLTSAPPGDRAEATTLARLVTETDATFAAGNGVFELKRETGHILAWKAP